MRWMFVASGVALLALGAWYFGKSTSVATPPTPTPTPTTTPVVKQESVAPATDSKADIAPLKMIEVIDLSRGYEPAPEAPETTLGGVKPASLITLPTFEDRMPLASGERWEPLTIAPREVQYEPLSIMPREVVPMKPELNLLEGLPFNK